MQSRPGLFLGLNFLISSKISYKNIVSLMDDRRYEFFFPTVQKYSFIAFEISKSYVMSASVEISCRFLMLCLYELNAVFTHEHVPKALWVSRRSWFLQLSLVDQSFVSGISNLRTSMYCVLAYVHSCKDVLMHDSWLFR